MASVSTSEGSEFEDSEGSSSDTDERGRTKAPRHRWLACFLGLACLALVAVPSAVVIWQLKNRPLQTSGAIEALFQGIAQRVVNHLENVTDDWDNESCRVNEAMPYSVTSCGETRHTNVTGFPGRSSKNIFFCLASAFGAPDSDGSPPQCRWDDVNDISEEMGWADAAVYNPEWSDDCADLKRSDDVWAYCDCLERNSSYWFQVFRDNLLKYCSDKYLIVLTRKDGGIGFSQRCEIRWMLRHAIRPLSCPIIPWNFDQLWEFRSLICRARQGQPLGDRIEKLFKAASEQVLPLITYQFHEPPSSTASKRYMEYLEGEDVSCWTT